MWGVSQTLDFFNYNGVENTAFLIQAFETDLKSEGVKNCKSSYGEQIVYWVGYFCLMHLF